jgi:CubicO group peptidase (beta-lactamase class C family)
VLAKHDRLRWAAGSKAAYSNLGYIALGELIAAASGQRYEDYVRTQILEPLSMTATGFSFQPDPTRTWRPATSPASTR